MRFRLAEVAGRAAAVAAAAAGFPAHGSGVVPVTEAGIR